MRAVDGLLTGWHEPEASHLLMLEAVAGRAAARAARTRPRSARGYLWHEFGDSHLILAGRGPDDARTRPGVTRRRCRPGGGRCSTRCAAAARRRPSEVAEPARHDRERRAPAPHRAGRRRARRGDRDAVARRPSAAGRTLAYSVTDRGRQPTSRRRTASSPTSCSATSPTADPELLDQLFAKRRDAAHRQRAPHGSRAKRTLGGQGRRAHPHPRRGRLPRDLRAGRAGVYRIVEHNCAILGRGRSATARRARARSTSSAPCCPTPTVERVQHMVAGARHCAYEVRAR